MTRCWPTTGGCAPCTSDVGGETDICLLRALHHVCVPKHFAALHEWWLVNDCCTDAAGCANTAAFCIRAELTSACVLPCSMELQAKRLMESVAHEQGLRRQLAEQLEQANKVTKLSHA